MLDRYWHGATSRISPEAPVPVVGVQATEERAGGAGNVALNAAGLGAVTVALGVTGDDEASGMLRSLLNARGVECRFVQTGAQPTISKLRIISRHQQLIRLDFEDDFHNIDHEALFRQYEDALAGHTVVIFSDYGKGTLAGIERMITAARDAGVPVLVDPKGGDFTRYHGATLITPNQTEFEAVVGRCPDEAAMIDRGQRLIDTLDLQALLITRSEKGMLLLQRGGRVLQLPTHAREVFDVTGAGDTVIAVFGAALAGGAGFEDATALANNAAGVVVGKLGTAAIGVAELEAAMREHEPLKRGIVDEASLLEQVNAARRSGERIVMTNGCFDILHAGHVAYLSQARELGDRLIVAVNDDDSVRRLKGPERPVNGLMQRMAVISGLESVDWVVPFGEDTPERLIDAAAPDVLVKGGDYTPDRIAGAAGVQKRGGEVVVLDYIDGCSTSAIIDSIRKPV